MPHKGKEEYNYQPGSMDKHDYNQTNPKTSGGDYYRPMDSYKGKREGNPHKGKGGY